MLEQFVGW